MLKETAGPGYWKMRNETNLSLLRRDVIFDIFACNITIVIIELVGQERCVNLITDRKNGLPVSIERIVDGTYHNWPCYRSYHVLVGDYLDLDRWKVTLIQPHC
ncbi:hypothetical protein JTB14_038457 [Gonioctena quinquepunctata]|nr:hypothetical protein JTB14_038457 [Gonioctena quinquepunctata]